MVLIIGISAVVVFVVLMFMFSRQHSSDVWGTAVIAAIVIFIVSLVGGVVTINQPSNLSETTRVSSPLKALQDSTGQEGSFFLMSGKVEDKYKFRYAVEDAGGVTRIRDIDPNKVGIVEDGKTTLVIVTTHYKSSIWFPGIKDFDTDYVFHVPAGSVKGGAEVDLK